ncbi:hypothetical protein [Nocardia farcinica]|uniref:hypothetical protein n=1 Tax=Nocardia farcinica TaxID=37329 RepID=UPI0034DAC061
MTGFVLSPRHMLVLTILAEMYGAPVDRVAAMLGVTLSSAYRATAKWREAHLVSALKIRPVPGYTWVFPSRAAVESLLPYHVKFWTPTPKMAAHVSTVLDLRLALVGLELDRWVPERQLRAELGMPKAGQPRGHVHDGRFYKSTGELVAVEVELSPKSATAARAAVAGAIAAARKAECAEVRYYCKTVWTDRDGQVMRRSDEIRNTIVAAVKSIPRNADDPAVRVAALEDALPVETGQSAQSSQPGLRVIEGGASDHSAQAAFAEAVSR